MVLTLIYMPRRSTKHLQNNGSQYMKEQYHLRTKRTIIFLLLQCVKTDLQEMLKENPDSTYI